MKYMQLTMETKPLEDGFKRISILNDKEWKYLKKVDKKTYEMLIKSTKEYQEANSIHIFMGKVTIKEYQLLEDLDYKEIVLLWKMMLKEGEIVDKWYKFLLALPKESVIWEKEEFQLSNYQTAKTIGHNGLM